MLHAVNDVTCCLSVELGTISAGHFTGNECFSTFLVVKGGFE